VTPLTIENHEFVLLAGRGVWRQSRRTLYVADLHIGKASAFAKGGVPIGATVLEGSTAADLERLSRLIEVTAAARVVILGDLLHAPSGRDARTLSLLAEWRSRHAGVDVTLVRGNHDHSAGDPPPEAGVHCVNAPFDHDGLLLLHHPLSPPTGRATLAGHLHPSVRLAARGDAARVDCFWLSRAQLVLPAFGAFTGRAVISPGRGDRVFALAGDRVIDVPMVPPGVGTAASAR